MWNTPEEVLKLQGSDFGHRIWKRSKALFKKRKSIFRAFKFKTGQQIIEEYIFAKWK